MQRIDTVRSLAKASNARKFLVRKHLKNCERSPLKVFGPGDCGQQGLEDGLQLLGGRYFPEQVFITGEECESLSTDLLDFPQVFQNSDRGT